MKLDYDLLRQILGHVEDVSDGQTLREIRPSTQLSTLGVSCESFDQLAYHFNILVENDLVTGSVQTLAHRGNKMILGLKYYGLTLVGHQLLDGLRQQGIWSRIKGSAEALGIGGLKQIPALAIALLTANA